MCLPGMCVRLMREEERKGEGEGEGEGEEEKDGKRGQREVMCELQVDWMYAEVCW